MYVNYYTVSEVVVLVTVTWSVRPLAVELLPRVSATMSNTSTAPPTTQTHGSVYQTVLSVLLVAVVETAVEVLSWAQVMAAVKDNRNNRNAFFKNPVLIECFILFYFRLKMVISQ